MCGLTREKGTFLYQNFKTSLLSLNNDIVTASDWLINLHLKEEKFNTSEGTDRS